MLVRTLLLLASTSLTLASPITSLNKRYGSIGYVASTPFQQKSSDTAFLVLDGDIGFIMQQDGNFVVKSGYSTTNPKALWSSQTAGSNCRVNNCLLNWQTDGNFVYYYNGLPKWSTHTSGHDHATLVFENVAPYIYIYNANGQVLWSSS